MSCLYTQNAFVYISYNLTFLCPHHLQEDEELNLAEAENGHGHLAAKAGGDLGEEIKPSGGLKFGWIKGVLVSNAP